MSEKPEPAERFTGLILLTGEDKPGIAQSLFSCLADFSIEILDVEQLIISQRLVLTALIALNSAHQVAIETDLNTLAANSEVDIAILFGKNLVLSHKHDLVSVQISKSKLHPKDLKIVTSQLSQMHLNIESISRISTSPTTLDLRISGGSKELIVHALESLHFDNQPTFLVRTT